MKRLDIIVEGQSEGIFVSQVLAPYLEKIGVIKSFDVSPIIVRTHPNYRGGLSKYSHLKKDIIKALSSSNHDIIVTTMIDYFRMPTNIPLPKDLISFKSDYAKAEAIEQCIADDIRDYRFIPYIQMHEFEALLFTSKTGFEYCYGSSDKRLLALNQIVDDYPNPEEINSSPSGAPSKRIISIIPEYQKDTDGNTIILENGITSILAKCPKFCKWINTLIAHLK